MAAVTFIAAGIQFRWALQLSFLTPYVQLLGVPHQWAAKIWLCGPISGMVIQPLNGLFSFFMAIGNILGYFAGSYEKLHTLFPFMETRACNAFCADLKSMDLLLGAPLYHSFYLHPSLRRRHPSYITGIQITSFLLGKLLGAFNGLPKSMWMLMVVTAINRVAWFPFFLFDTDWMGNSQELNTTSAAIGRLLSELMPLYLSSSPSLASLSQYDMLFLI
ncbi:unnamed protein product [Trifolium pratense]|uniref:Uncharacterized protein n=1 Tax=Trifolium pratense TaxID=57577 RepID=A0ACB0KBJ0_TRIPR|nr:unnamed protein product [Trifolium pratense]